MRIGSIPSAFLMVSLVGAGGGEAERFSLDDSPMLLGDSLEHSVCWERSLRRTASGPFAHLTGKPVRLRFVMRDADLFSLRFQPRKESKMQASGRVNSFDTGRESWQIYDYNGGSGGQNVFFLASWEKTGGLENSGYIWADDSRWRIDTPEDPHSILPLILYHRWVALDAEEDGSNATPRPTGFRKKEAMDLRGAEVSVHLRGDGLDLKGAQCYFWVHSGGTRWHYTGRPLKIHEGKWGPPERFVLVNDESQWHRSWAPSGHSLDSLLKKSAS